MTWLWCHFQQGKYSTVWEKNLLSPYNNYLILWRHNNAKETHSQGCCYLLREGKGMEQKVTWVCEEKKSHNEDGLPHFLSFCFLINYKYFIHLSKCIKGTSKIFNLLHSSGIFHSQRRPPAEKILFQKIRVQTSNQTLEFRDLRPSEINASLKYYVTVTILLSKAWNKDCFSKS